MKVRLFEFSKSISIHILLIILIDQYLVVDVFSQRVNARNQQQQELRKLREIIEEEIEQKQHHLAEQWMDGLIQLMGEFGYATEELSAQVQARIRYSLREKRFLSAYDAAMRWIEQHPRDLQVINLLGSTTTYMKRYREARDFLRTVYESDPENEYFQERFLYVLKGLKDRDEGVPLCHKILANEDSTQRVKLAAINGLIELEMEAETLGFLDQVEPFDGIESYRAYVKGVVAFKENRFQEALELFQKVESGSSRYFSAQKQKAMCLFRLQRYDEAAMQNLTVLSYQLYDQNAYVNLAQCLARLKNVNGSKTILGFQKRIEHSELPIKEGDYYWSKGDLLEYGRLHVIGLNSKFNFREAERLLETICQIMPESIPAKINLGKHYFTTLQAAKAGELFSVLLKQTEGIERESIQVLLVEALLRQGRIADALQIAAVTKQNKDKMNALLGSYYLEMKHQPSKAIGYLDRIEDATYIIQTSHAKCLSQLKQPEKAMEILERIPGEFASADHGLIQVDCLIQLDRLDEAKLLFEKVIREFEDLLPFLTVPIQAKLSKELGNHDAKALMEKSESLHPLHRIIQEKVMEAQRIGLPDSVAIFEELSELFEDMGDHKNALLYARRAYDAEPNQPEHLTRLIGLLTEDEHVIERYHMIQKSIRTKKITQNFEQELGEVFQVLGLNRLAH